MDRQAFVNLLKSWQPELRHKEKAAILGVELETFKTWIQGRHSPTDFVKQCVQKAIEAYDRNQACLKRTSNLGD